METVEQFEEFIIGIQKKHNKPVQILAHSMGGVITMSVINKNPDLFHSVVFVGVPFGSGIGYIHDLQEGIPLGYNKLAFTPKVLFSFPSSFWTFPHKDEKHPFYTGIYEFDEKCPISSLPNRNYAAYSVSDNLFDLKPESPDPIPIENKWNLTKVDIDFYNAKDWLKYKIGLFSSEEYSEEETKILLEHLQNCLDKGKQFRMSIQYKEDVKYPPMSVVSGDKYPTIVSIYKEGPNSIHGLDFTSAPRIYGDGRIPYNQSFPDERIPHKKVSSDLHHQILLNDLPLYYSLLNELLL